MHDFVDCVDPLKKILLSLHCVETTDVDEAWAPGDG
jgi:hypothetical protein